MSEERFAYLQEIVTWTPSKRTWKAIVRLFANWPPGKERDDAVKYASGELDHWNPLIRKANKKEGHPCWPLVTNWDLKELDSDLNMKDVQNILHSTTNIRCLDLSHEQLEENIHFLRSASGIEALQVHSLFGKEDKGLFWELRHLKSLELETTYKDETLEPFRQLFNLERLRVGWGRFGSIRNIDALEELTRINELCLPNCTYLESLDVLPFLRNLRVFRARRLLRVENVEVLKSCPLLNELELDYISQEQAHIISSLSTIRKLILEHPNHFSLNCLFELSKLSSLVFWDCSEVHSVEGLEKCSRLEEVALFYGDNLRSIESLQKLPLLKSLRLDWITCLESLEPIRKMESLKILNLQRFQSSKDLSFLPESGSLKQLTLESSLVLESLYGIQWQKNIAFLRLCNLPNLKGKHYLKGVSFLESEIEKCPSLETSLLA